MRLMSNRDNAGYAEGRPGLLDKDRARLALGEISRQTLDRLRRRGELADVRIGRRVFFRPEDIDDYIERRRQAAA